MAQPIWRISSIVGWSGRRIQNTRDSHLRLLMSPPSGTKLEFRRCSLFKVRDTAARRTLATFLQHVCHRRFSRKFVVTLLCNLYTSEHVHICSTPYIHVSFHVGYEIEAQKGGIPIVVSSNKLVRCDTVVEFMSIWNAETFRDRREAVKRFLLLDEGCWPVLWWNFTADIIRIL